MSNSLLEQLSAINDLVEDVIAENNELKAALSSSGNPHCLPNRKKLTKREVEQIRILKRNSALSNRAIADIFEINNATVSRILRGIYHK